MKAKNINTSILKWLSDVFKYKDYPHSFKDQWIIWNIWDGRLCISFDSRVEEQTKLISLIPPQFMGTPQHRTLTIVNEKIFYLNLETIINIKCPDIVSSKLIAKNKHQSTEKGWSIKGEYFYTYDWELTLSDGTIIHHHGHHEKMELDKDHVVYRTRVQEERFIEFVKKYAKNL